MSQARRQRRQLAKQFGFLGKKESIDQMRERLNRSQKMGKQIHLKNLENIKNNQMEDQRLREIALKESSIKEIPDNNKIAGDDEKLGLKTGSFDFLQDLKTGPEASDETEPKDNA